MEVALLSYANTHADVVDHVVFGVDPPVNANFFSAVVWRIRSNLLDKSSYSVVFARKIISFGPRLPVSRLHSAPYVVGSLGDLG
ncbi:hypothetical protein UPYG_G00305640 [Umbra pygmaea]|uniref:Uncharacterized protein n=1 Tax=Umbra pygmaea TaxID=75934 RepID=A0ABD0VYQ4_UMBPY